MKKKLTLFVVALMGVLSMNAQGIIVHKTDGTQIKMPLAQLDSIAFYPADDVTPQPGVEPVLTSDLTGEWEDGGLGFSNDYSLTFTAEQVTVKQEGTVVYQGAYTLENNVVSFTINGTTYKSMAGLAGGQSVMIMKEVSEDGYENLAFILVQKGKTINTKKEDIQGQWVWWETWEDETTGTIERSARISHKFQGDTCELILPAWGRKFVGTYTYVNGVVHFKITEGYTSREEGTGYGWGEGDLDPATLEGNWKTLYKENWEFDELDGLFFVIGDEAYSFMMMPCICTRKVQTR